MLYHQDGTPGDLAGARDHNQRAALRLAQRLMVDIVDVSDEDTQPFEVPPRRSRFAGWVARWFRR